MDKIPDMSDSINGIDTFKELYTDYFQAVWGFCNTYLKDREQAMDATQETFFKLYERLDDSYTKRNAGCLHLYHGKKYLYGYLETEQI